MTTKLSRKWSFRTGAVRSEEIGYVLGAYDAIDEDEHPHTALFNYNKGEEWGQKDIEWIATSCCVSIFPKEQMVAVGRDDQYAVLGSGEFFEGKIGDSLKRRPKDGELSAVRDVAGKAHVVGMGKQVYRRDGRDRWTDLGARLPDSGGFEAIHGYSQNDLYAAGWKGEIWHFDGRIWEPIKSRTKKILTGVCCAADGFVYACGMNGVLMRGRGSRWELIKHGETEEDFWDVEWFQGRLYVSTLSFVYTLKGDSLTIDDMNENPASTCYHLSSTKDQLLWSVGLKNVMVFDGKKWKRIE